MKIAIIGGGVSGMVTARLLCADHEITLFEANDYLGGHTHTIDVEAGGLTWAVDTGDWTVVLMNSAGTADVAADVSVGAEVPALDWLVPLLLAVAGAALVAGIVLVALPLRAASRR